MFQFMSVVLLDSETSHSNRHRKGLGCPFIVKALNKQWPVISQHSKGYSHKPTANLIIISGKLNAFPQRTGRRQGCPLSILIQ